MNSHLIAGQSIPLTPDGNWLYVKSSQAEIEVYRQDTGERVKLAKSSVFNVGEGKTLGRLILSSRVDNEIELQFGYGTFTPPMEGQSVIVQALPSVDIQTLPSVDIQTLPSVDIQTLPSVDIQTLPPVEVAPNQQIEVSQLPALHIESMPPITQSAPIDVRLESSLTALKISRAQAVLVEEMASESLITEAVSVFPHNIPAKDTRKTLIIKASKNNAESVFIDAFELEAGERINVCSRAAMTITGTAGDNITLMEM